jgi:hypothetical protein
MSMVVPQMHEPLPAPARKKLSKKERLEVLVTGKGKCGICRTKIVGAFEVDHRISLGRGGKDDASNWQPAHPACHLEKTCTIDTPGAAKIKRQTDTCVARKGEERPKSRIPKRANPWPPKGSQKINRARPEQTASKGSRDGQ